MRVIVFDYRLDDQGSIPGRGKQFFLQPLCPDQLSSPPRLLLSKGYRGSFPGGKALPVCDGDHSLHLLPRSRMSRSYTPSPTLPPQWR
jgi:hypothetical protein